MKTARFITKTLFYIFLFLDIVIFSFIIYLKANVSNDFKIKRGSSLEINTIVPVTAVYNGTKLSNIINKTGKVGEEFSVDLKVFGFIPFSTVNVEVVDELYVVLLGNPFGMKLYTEGVLVTELTEVKTNTSNMSPAKTSGIREGDYIISVDDVNVYTNEDLSKVVENSGGKKLKFKILRNSMIIYINCAPSISSETGTYKIGIWVKDSSAGIGTLTFYSPATDVICGLGHGVCDEDSDKLLKLNSGEMVSAEIISVEKGQTGSPGQLKGRFTNKTLGKVCLNCDDGVYSRLTGKLNITTLTEIALKQEVKNGKAQILCTVDGNTPKLYSCEVTIRTSAYHSDTQNLLVTVTDPELLKITGGIVQGMSGSPIIQNGKLIGAVTHVLVDDPTKGYGIFAENMLETAKNVEQLKDAG